MASRSAMTASGKLSESINELILSSMYGGNASELVLGGAIILGISISMLWTGQSTLALPLARDGVTNVIFDLAGINQARTELAPASMPERPAEVVSDPFFHACLHVPKYRRLVPFWRDLRLDTFEHFDDLGPEHDAVFIGGSSSSGPSEISSCHGAAASATSFSASIYWRRK